jgi:hypothetical protein
MKKAGLVCSLGILLFALSCGHPTQMVSMSISPSASTVIGITSRIPVQYSAYGTYIHPAETRDVTKEVTWSSSVPMVATVSNGLVIPTGAACGGTLITATAGKDLVGQGSYAKVITATATFTVADPTIEGCPAQ